MDTWYTYVPHTKLIRGAAPPLPLPTQLQTDTTDYYNPRGWKQQSATGQNPLKKLDLLVSYSNDWTLQLVKHLNYS